MAFTFPANKKSVFSVGLQKYRIAVDIRSIDV